MSTDERRQAMVEFIRSDEEKLNRSALLWTNWSLQPEKYILLSKFLEQGAEAEVLDPIAIHWLELNATDVAKMSHWLKEANEFFLTKVLEGKVDPEHPWLQKTNWNFVAEKLCNMHIWMSRSSEEF